MGFDFTKEPGKCLLNRNLNRDELPLISIITPFYNSGEHFEQTFNCVVNQSFPWFEWIIVDDGSTDEKSLSLLRKLSCMDPRIRLIRQENKGLGASRNIAVKNISTGIFIPLDADDLIEPTYVETVYWALKYNPNASWAYTDSCGFGDQEYLWQKNFSSQTMKTHNLLVCTAAIRKAAFELVGGYKEDRLINEDWDFWLRLLAAGAYPVHVKGVLFWYRRKEKSLLSTVQSNQKHAAKVIRKDANSIHTTISAIEYPRGLGTESFLPPVKANWTLNTFLDNKKTKILLLLPWMEMGGADKFNLDLCAGLDKSKYELGIVTLKASSNRWQQLFSEYVTDIFNLPDFLEVENYPEFISYYISSRNVDIVLVSNTYYGYYIASWLRAEHPMLSIVDYVHMEEWYWRNGGFARLSGMLGDYFDKTYVCNENTRKILIDHFGRTPNSVKTIYIGTDEEKFDPKLVQKGVIRNGLSISDDRPIILFPCRIHPQKRPFLMVEIAKALKRKIPSVAFVVVGDGPQQKELCSVIKREKLDSTIYYAGSQSDMLPWYRDSNLTLICSLKEGLALTAYESLSMGVPVVTSDVGGQKELINSSVGRVIPLVQTEKDDLDKRNYSTHEISLYVDAITDILSDAKNYEQICNNCRKTIANSFSTSRMLKQFDDEFRDLNCSPRGYSHDKNVTADIKRIGELVTLYCQLEEYDLAYKQGLSDEKNELLRIANSRLGKKLINVFFKMKLNKLF